MKYSKWTLKIHKADKNAEKMSSKEDWLYFQISTQKPTLLNIGCFWQYFVPMSIVLHVNVTSFFKCSSISRIISLIANFYCYTMQLLYVKLFISLISLMKRNKV